MRTITEAAVSSLSLGSRFGMLLKITGRVLRGQLISVSYGSAFVEWDSLPRTVEIHDLQGNEGVFQANVRRREQISLQTLVIPEAQS